MSSHNAAKLKMPRSVRTVLKTVALAVLTVSMGGIVGFYAAADSAAAASRLMAEQLREITPREGCVCPLDRNLPVFYIDAGGQDINAEPDRITEMVAGQEIIRWEQSPRYRVTLTLFEPGEHGYICVCGVEEPSFSRRISVNTRGQSSLVMPKNQYTLTLEGDELIDGEPVEQPISLLGMPEHHQWILNASYVDRSLLRNALAYSMAEQTMEYAPRFGYCELLLNLGDGPMSYEDHYWGVFLLQEKIERDGDRVNIQRADPGLQDIAFIVARDKIKAHDGVFQTDWGVFEDEFIMGADGRVRQRTVLKSIYPGASMTDDYFRRIQTYLNSFEYALGSNNFDRPGSAYRDMIDVNSFIQYALVNEVLKNIDGGVASTYFYKDLGGKLKAGPVWDFDITLGNSQILEHDLGELDAMRSPVGLHMIDVPWFSRMFQDTAFAGQFEREYRYLRRDQWSDENLEALINELLAELGPAAQRNTVRWYAEAPFDYLSEVEDMKQFLRLRTAWMDRNIHLARRLRGSM
jgi:hypothetical protein